MASPIFCEACSLYRDNWVKLIALHLLSMATMCCLPIGPVASILMGCGYFMMILNALRESNTTKFMRTNDIFSAMTLVVPIMSQLLVMAVIFFCAFVSVIVSAVYMHHFTHSPALTLATVIVMLIPVFFVYMKLAYAIPVLLEFHTHKIGVFRAMAVSATQVHKHCGQVILTQFCIWGIVASSGAILCFVGVIFTVPLAIVMECIVFREMFGLKKLDHRAANCVCCI